MATPGHKSSAFINLIDSVLFNSEDSSYLARLKDKKPTSTRNKGSIRLADISYFIYAIYSTTIQDFE